MTPIMGEGENTKKQCIAWGFLKFWLYGTLNQLILSNGTHFQQLNNKHGWDNFLPHHAWYNTISCHEPEYIVVTSFQRDIF
jgi:hypothetical protein